MNCCNHKNKEGDQKEVQKDGQKWKFYTCPMHPEVKEDKPGLCVHCGMNLVEMELDIKDKPSEEAHEGHDQDDQHEQDGHKNIFLVRFWISFVLTIPVILYSGIFRRFFDWTPPSFTGSEYLPAILASIVFFYGGWIFLASAWRELRAKMPGMMTLIALAIITAYIYSVVITIIGGDNVLFWELTSLITIMLLGHWLEMRAVQGAQGALRALSKLLPDTAEVIRDGEPQVIQLSELKEGDILHIRPGSKVPADARVVEGDSEVDESMITGESRPVNKKKGAEIIAGTINGNGSLRAEVTKIGDDTFLAGIMRLVAEAQASKSKLQLLSDKAAYLLTLVAIGVGVTAFASWSLFTDAGTAFALTRLVAVLVIACPHALGLAIPLVASISTTMAAQNGFLVRQRLALEMARSVDVVLFDKTGTLTEGKYGVTKVWNVNAQDENEVLRLAAAVDSHSEHYVSKAIVKKAKENDSKLPDMKNFERLPGKGVRGIVGSDTITAGGAALLNDFKPSINENLQKEMETEGQKGKTIIYAFRNNDLLGVIALNDLIRKESREAVKNLQESGIRVAMITGDSENVARWVAEDLGIDEYFARVLPDQKAKQVKLLQEKNLKVAMVGDGINDAAAIVQADLGIAIGAGTNVAIESAGIILIKNDPRDIAKIVKLSQLTYRKMIQNLFWASGYNIVAIPLAAGVLASKGILLNPAVAAIFMSFSTVIVAINAVLMRKAKLTK